MARNVPFVSSISAIFLFFLRGEKGSETEEQVWRGRGEILVAYSVGNPEVELDR